MRKIDIIRAWKDEDYRLSLSEEERKMLPANPAGSADLSTDKTLHAGTITFLTPAITTFTWGWFGFY